MNRHREVRHHNARRHRARGIRTLGEQLHREEREKAEPPAETRKRFYDLIQKTRKSEEKFLDLLVKGGYVDGK